MTKRFGIVALLLLLSLVAVVPAFAGGNGRGSGPVIYVTSQDLYYDSIVLTDLPAKGPFQKLEMGDHGPQTEFGPGDQGYVGGRWWLDVNGNNEMDEGDSFFLCPLLGPGRETP